MAGRHEDMSDEDLEALVERFSQRRTYRPTDERDEPDEVPQGPSGTSANASGASGGDGPQAS